MKCVRLTDGTIKRVRNDDGHKLVREGASFINKDTWKTEVRDINKKKKEKAKEKKKE